METLPQSVEAPPATAVARPSESDGRETGLWPSLTLILEPDAPEAGSREPLPEALVGMYFNG